MDLYKKRPQVIPRPRPMKVLVLGLPRTGTTSFCEAMRILGLRTYHWNEVLKNSNNDHLRLWLKAMEAKYDNRGTPFAGEDFDQMLWEYDAVSDEPCCFFVDELIAAYPEAKVVLTTRNRETWLQSMQGSILKILSWKSWIVLSWFDREFTAPYYSLLKRTTSVLSHGIPAYEPAAYSNLAQSFDDHNEYVRAAVPANNLLEFHPSQGWGPLCSFLELPVPKEDFPHLNEPKSLLQLRSATYWARWRVVAWTMAKALIMLCLFLVVAWRVGGK